jgi:hypothetical protein
MALDVETKTHIAKEQSKMQIFLATPLSVASIAFLLPQV